MAPITIKSKEEFASIEKQKACLCIFHFFADWAEQCKQMDEVFTELNNKHHTSLKFYRIEAEKLPEISLKCGIVAVPTFIFMQDGKVIDQLNGANAAELNEKVERHIRQQADIGSTDTEQQAKQKENDLRERLKKLINAGECMLFMKGTPTEPRCGFSKQVIAILTELNAQYSTFNILADDDVREGLKAYSDWPTYPQLYVKGELIGGLDIIKEMVASGELVQKIPHKQSLDDRLKSLLNKASVMIFMKGQPSTPQCKFSKQLMNILSDTKVSFETFNILEDEEVRQGLKTFSNWPTYPQIYVKGELIGGLDIVKELQEGGELESTLNPPTQ